MFGFFNRPYLFEGESFGQSRSPLWDKKRIEHLTKFPNCEACGKLVYKNNKVIFTCSVHHKKPFHLYPELELVDENLATMCCEPNHNCHLWIGHLFDFKSWNPNFDKTVERLRIAIETRPYKRI